MSSQLGIHPVQNLPRYACPAQSRFWIISSSLCNDFALNYKPELCTYLTFKRMVCSGCLKFSERFKPALCTYLFFKTMGCSSRRKFSESKNRWFQFFEGKKKIRIRESLILDISETFTESTVFMEELTKDRWLGRKFFEFFKNGNSIRKLVFFVFSTPVG